MQIEEKIKDLFEKGKTPNQISKELKLSLEEIRNYLRQLNKQGMIQTRKQSNQEKNRWNSTEKEIQARRNQIIQLYEKGILTGEIAKILQCSVNTVTRDIMLLKSEGKISLQSIKKRETIKKSKKKEENETLEQAIITLCLQGKSRQEMADALQISIAKIYRELKKLREEGRIPNQEVLMEKKILQKERIKTRNQEIQKLYEDGKRQKEIAKILQVSETTVSNTIKKIKGQIQDEKQENHRLEENKQLVEKAKKKLQEGTLKKEELEKIKNIIQETKNYDDIIFYIKACIHFYEFYEATNILDRAISEDTRFYTDGQKRKMRIAIKDIEQIQLKRIAKCMLKSGKNITETVQYTGLSKNEVEKMKQVIDRNQFPINPTER